MVLVCFLLSFWIVNERPNRDLTQNLIRNVLEREESAMTSSKCNRGYSWIAFLMFLPALLWSFSSTNVAMADYHADSAHGNTGAGVNRSGAGFSIGDCAHCHDTFDPDICGDEVNYPSMLFDTLDTTTVDSQFCMKCHRPSGSLQVQPPNMSDASKNIYTIYRGNGPFYTDYKKYGHRDWDHIDKTQYISGIHRFWNASPPAQSSADVEDRDYLSNNAHIECNDCHNPHTAESGLHSSNAVHVAAGTNEIADSGPLTGAFGVEPDPWSSSNWGGATDWPTTSETATKEYQICFKCHSDYVPWDDGGTGPASWTDVALEFNPANQSYHPVVQALPAEDPGVNGSSRLPAPFTSLLIGDSGKSTSTSTTTITDSTKSSLWTANKWQNWGLRIGYTSYVSDTRYNNIRRISSNTTTQLTVSPAFSAAPASTATSYSIEYYAGQGTKSGLTVTDTNKNFTQYTPSLVGYRVVISNDTGSAVGWGTVQSNTATSFTVSYWLDANVYGGVYYPNDGTVGYYFSATGQTMMCSDCHSNDTISTAAAQGPHGSNVKWMLKGRNRSWPRNYYLANGKGTLEGGSNYVCGPTTGNGQYANDGTVNGLFCLNCHSTVSFCKDDLGRNSSDAFGNIHLRHGGRQCIACHIMVPHGGKMSRLIGDSDGNMPARYAFNNALGNMDVQSFKKAAGGLYGDGPTRYYLEGIKCAADCHVATGDPDENW